MGSVGKIHRKFIGLLPVLLVTAAAPAWASGVSITPANITLGTNDGSIVVNAFNFVPQVIGTYSGPVTDTKSVSSVSNANALLPGTASATGSLTITNGTTPAIFTRAQVDLTGLAGATAGVQDITHYSFAITGPSGSTQVMVNATGSIGFSPAAAFLGAGNATASMRVQQQFNGPIIIDQMVQLTSVTPGLFIDGLNSPTQFTSDATRSFTVAQNFSFLTNTIYDVTLQAQSGIRTNISSGSVSESIFANIDPQFTVEGPYTFVVSPGFGGFSTADLPGPGVPEPASWAMLVLGFAGVGAVLRSNRRRGLTPAEG